MWRERIGRQPSYRFLCLDLFGERRLRKDSGERIGILRFAQDDPYLKGPHIFTFLIFSFFFAASSSSSSSRFT